MIHDLKPQVWVPVLHGLGVPTCGQGNWSHDKETKNISLPLNKRLLIINSSPSLDISRKIFHLVPFCTPLISCESRYCFQDWNLVADCGLASAAASANNWQHVKTDFNSNSSEVTLLPYNTTPHSVTWSLILINFIIAASDRHILKCWSRTIKLMW